MIGLPRDALLMSGTSRLEFVNSRCPPASGIPSFSVMPSYLGHVPSCTVSCANERVALILII